MGHLAYMQTSCTFLLSLPYLNGIPVCCRVSPSIKITRYHLNIWVEGGNVRVICHLQEHIAEKQVILTGFTPPWMGCESVCFNSENYTFKKLQCIRIF